VLRAFTATLALPRGIGSCRGLIISVAACSIYACQVRAYMPFLDSPVLT
jgi:hypothetical protein